jgi:uncharacterized protein (DUF885 family)
MGMKMDTPKISLSRRDFLKLACLAGGAVVLSPLLKACASVFTTEAIQTPLTPDGELIADLEGLDIDAFFEEAYRRWLIRDPENLTTLGLADRYGVGDAALTDLSDAFIHQTQGLERGTLDLLRGYDRSSFTPGQKLTADIYEWYLDDAVRGHEFMYNDYPVNPIITSVHYNLFVLFTRYHPLNNQQDAEDYISRLSSVSIKIAQLMDGLQRRQERGVILPAFMIPFVLADINEIAGSPVRSHPFYLAFNERLTGITTGDREAYLDQVGEQINSSVIPGYQSLADYLGTLRRQASNDVGVWQFPDGAAYYAQSLRRQTTTDLTAEEIHALGKQHVERIHGEMRTLFARLGYPETESIPALYARLTDDSGVFEGQAAVTAYEQAISNADDLLPQAFDILPRTGVQVVGGTEGDYYMPASYDGSRPGLFFARTTGGTPKFGVKSLAYHETIPGHHLQTAIAQEQTGLPALRQGMQFNAYTEGWALYAERLMAELGAYTGDPQGDLGRLQMECYRAARLVVDTGIHAMLWGFGQAADYLCEATGFDLSMAQGEITRYSVWPGQATSYYVGFLKFLELRQKAMDALGERFDLKTFHHIILVNGSVPLTVLERLVDDYIRDAA